MSGLTDDELPGYLRIHCDTEVGLVHVNHLARLHELAGRNDDARRLRESGNEWWRPSPEWIAEVATEAEARMSANQ